MSRLWTRIAMASGAIILIGTLATAAYLNNRVDSLSARVSELNRVNHHHAATPSFHREVNANDE